MIQPSALAQPQMLFLTLVIGMARERMAFGGVGTTTAPSYFTGWVSFSVAAGTAVEREKILNAVAGQRFVLRHTPELHDVYVRLVEAMCPELVVPEPRDTVEPAAFTAEYISGMSLVGFPYISKIPQIPGW